MLAGTDVLGQAATGTGKTAAFALPLIDRLLYRFAIVPAARRGLLRVRERRLARQLVGEREVVRRVDLVGGQDDRQAAPAQHLRHLGVAGAHPGAGVVAAHDHDLSANAVPGQRGPEPHVAPADANARDDLVHEREKQRRHREAR